jgi:capsular polysaccharide transport system ATP-binding protein
MIELSDVTKYYYTKSGSVRRILTNVTTAFPERKNVGILGRNGVGKSTLLRLLALAEKPNAGTIKHRGRVSWPLGFSGGFLSNLSAVDNIRFISRIYGSDWKEVLAFVEDFADVGDYIDMPMKTYSSGMRSRVAFGMSMAIEFDCYLIDEGFSVSDDKFVEKARAMFDERKERSNLIIVSHNERHIRQQCQVAYILDRAQLTFYEDVEEALEVYANGA